MSLVNLHQPAFDDKFAISANSTIGTKAFLH